jgi:hypothetical protein
MSPRLLRQSKIAHRSWRHQRPETRLLPPVPRAILVSAELAGCVCPRPFLDDSRPPNSGSARLSFAGPIYVQTTPPRSMHGYDFNLTLLQNPLFCFEGTSTHWPETSYFQPWYGQWMPSSSFRPNHKEAPLWVQNSSIRPSRPDVSRKAMSRSDRSVTRTGGQSGSGSSEERRNGIQ